MDISEWMHLRQKLCIVIALSYVRLSIVGEIVKSLRRVWWINGDVTWIGPRFHANQCDVDIEWLEQLLQYIIVQWTSIDL